MLTRYLEFIAETCHQANKMLCQNNLDLSQKDWNEAEEWQRQSAIKGVEFRLENPNCGHDAQHNNWMEDKIKNGWVYGEVKDPIAKTHPCLVPYVELPEFQQRKDRIFCAIVDALKIVDEDFAAKKAQDITKLTIVKVINSSDYKEEITAYYKKYIGKEFPLIRELEICPVCYELDVSSIEGAGARAMIIPSMFCEIVENIELKTKS